MHVETLHALARELAERIRSAEDHRAGGCPTCRDGEARAFLAHLHRLAAEAAAPGGDARPGYLESDSA